MFVKDIYVNILFTFFFFVEIIYVKIEEDFRE